MIRQEEVFRIGKFTKPHGVKGEICLAFDNDIFDRSNCSYLVCLTDGIFVPFFVNEYRFKGQQTALFLLDGIDNEDKARKLCGLDVYFPRKYVEESDSADADYSWNYFIGFSITDQNNNTLGTIEAVDDATLNTLFLVKNNEGEDLIIPATEDFITEVDNDNRILYMNIPEGLVE